MKERLLLEATGVSKRASERWLLWQVSLSLGAGRTLAVMGPNGAGKSTLIRVLAGLTRMDGGRLRWGEPPSTPSGTQRGRIGLLGHEPGLFEALTGRQNLRFFAGLYGLDGALERVEEALSEVGLMFWAEDPVRHYSRGMRQRLGLARALLHAPGLLLLDEPFTGLDPDSSGWLHKRLERFRSGGGGTLLVSHRFDEVMALADEFLILCRGRVAASGPVEGMSEIRLQELYAQALATHAPAPFSGRR